MQAFIDPDGEDAVRVHRGYEVERLGAFVSSAGDLVTDSSKHSVFEHVAAELAGAASRGAELDLGELSEPAVFTGAEATALIGAIELAHYQASDEASRVVARYFLDEMEIPPEATTHLASSGLSLAAA